MLTVEQVAPNQINLSLEGEITAEETQHGIEELLKLTEPMQNGRLLYRIGEFEWPSIFAMGVKMQYLPRLFSLIGKLDRCALLTDEAWVATAARAENVLIPGVDIKVFSLNESADAQAWLDEPIEA